MIKVKRFFLELKVNPFKKIDVHCSIKIEKIKDFNLNKFFYKQVGADHYWRDRLIWLEKDWIKYVSKKNLSTFVLYLNDEPVGFYEQEYHPALNEMELINMGVLKEHRGKKFGSILLKHSIKTAFTPNLKRMWVHTCSLDHKFALKNYESKGFKIFKEEEISFVA